ncbi:hypothetical protein EDB85DRAFT_2151544 [Lactarius pseudohatsudake]|nr:hypothetical protein EDB85DRAFT_2151544 [Lactarius pseudohatsudake]
MYGQLTLILPCTVCRTVFLPGAPHPRPHTQLTRIPALPNRPRSPRLPRQQACQSPLILFSFVLAHIPCSWLPILTRVSKHFSAAAQLTLYCTLELSADDTDACIAQLAVPAQSVLPFDMELLSAAPGTLTHLMLLADTLPYAFFNGFLAARARLTHLALPHFVGVPPTAQDVPSAAMPRLAVLDNSPGLTAVLAPGHPLHCVTLHIASTLYDGLRPTALLETLVTATGGGGNGSSGAVVGSAAAGGRV